MTHPDTSLSPRKCGFWKSHRWSEWKKTREGALTDSRNETVGFIFFQERQCQDCGFTEINKQKSMIYG